MPMEKSFTPAEVEPRWRARWEKLRVGIADPHSPKPSFTIALPPPNITGALHLGHACGGAVQDILARHRRMNGFEVEWCPGTDHAAIATNAVIERALAAEGTSKEEIGRPAFFARVEAWYAEYGGRILDQMRRLGFSLDWSRTRFTLDDAYVRAIRVVFKALYDEGLIYRGPRLVNWCPRCRSAISDEEIDWREHEDLLTELIYPVEEGGTVTVATVRPETMLGDSAVAINAADPRHAALRGKHVVLPLTNRRVPIIEDDAVRVEFGTGALKVTPGHDLTDYEIGRRHDLAFITVIAPDGTMECPDLPQFHGMPTGLARGAITDALRVLGAVGSQVAYVHEVGHCDRCGDVLEPQISEQWWVAMQPLAAPAIRLVTEGGTTFHPKRYADVYLSWMNNIRDWCISRQIWLGHAIPVSVCGNGHRFAWVDRPAACPDCGDTALSDDPDVLDTWFSSALWPYAIFGWPERTPDLERFYPTDVLVTDRGIIFLWVARMMMTGLKFTGARPFSDVIITSTIQAPDGSRMSKSKGNVVDPLQMIDRYGADAVRAWGAAVGTAGQDMRFDEDRIRSYQRFANKLWNVTRFLVVRLAGDDGTIAVPAPVEPAALQAEDRWILARVAETVHGVDRAVASYRFHEAMERLYDTVWRSFCDWYIEMAKPRLRDDAAAESRAAATWTALSVLDVLLRALHPFMPFITEECAQYLPAPTDTLQHREWPAIPSQWLDDTGRAQSDGVEELLDLVQKVRNARQEAGIAPSNRDRQAVVLDASRARLDARDISRLLEVLAPVRVTDGPDNGERPVVVVAGGIEAALYVGGSGGDDSARLSRQLAEVEDRIARLETQLGNAAFVERARAEVVDEARRRLTESVGQRDTLRRMLDGGGEPAAATGLTG